MNLQNRFSDLLLQTNFNSNKINDLWLDLEKAYSAKTRLYHNLNHLIAMIELFDLYSDFLKNPNEILFSIFYHDYVYKASRKDNELKSAQRALSILPPNVNMDKQLIFEAICATQTHQNNQIEDINWLIDFDLKILSATWPDYQIYSNQIRNEYKIYPDFIYKPGRKKALEHFLENECIYKTAVFKNLYEQQARLNIATEIDTIAL